MNSNQPTRDSRRPEVQQRYTTPSLVILGSVTELTLGASGPFADGNSNRNAKH